MPTLFPFSTITEMFSTLVRTCSERSDPIVMFKSNGAYRGISYKELARSVEEFAAGLAARGIRRGDRVALISENRPEWIVADLASMSIGAVNVSIYPTLTPKQIEHILRDSGATSAVVSNKLQLGKLRKIDPGAASLHTIVTFADTGGEPDERVVTMDSLLGTGRKCLQERPDLVRAEAAKARPEDLLTLIYTSGTTGDPKGVMLTHANLSSNIHAATAVIPFVKGDILLSFLPLCHAYERMAGYYAGFACGCTLAFAESIETVRDNLLEVRPTIITTVPRVLAKIHAAVYRQAEKFPPIKKMLFHWAVRAAGRAHRLRDGGNRSLPAEAAAALADLLVMKKIRARTGGRVRFFVSGGAALEPSLQDFFESARIPVIQGYGLTETSPVISVNLPDRRRRGTVGPPIPGIEVSIAPDGEILVRGPNVMRGYWENPEATGEMIDESGWLHTGDIGTIDAQGFLAITDRKKHIFVNPGGKNISPQAVENAISRSPLVDQIVVLGDGKDFLTALIVPNFDAVREAAGRKGLGSPTDREITTTAGIVAMIKSEIDGLQKDLAGFERVRKFRLLDAPFSLEGGEITPTMKVRRASVEHHYKALIEEMYATDA